MTLKEKFCKIEIKLGENDTTYLVSSEANEIEKIADEFAIGFAKWVLDRFTFKDYIHKDSKELLEMYKKEKGL